MKAVRIHNYGQASELVLEDTTIPQLGARDVLIRVAASGVNPIDWKIRAGYMAQVMSFSLPLTMGWECAGTVESVGNQVDTFKPGDRVYTMVEFARGGTYAEYIAVNAAQVALMPRSISFSVAASIPMTAQAAWTAIEAADLHTGQHVLIHGGAGGVGSIAIQLAKAKGAHVTTTVSTDDVAHVKALGADVVIDFKISNFADQVHHMDAVVDTLGGPTQEASWRTLKAGGVLVALTQPPAPGKAEAAGVRAVAVLTTPHGEVLKEIANMIDAGKLKPVACHEYPLAHAAQVHERGEAGNLKGRTVLRVSQDWPGNYTPAP